MSRYMITYIPNDPRYRPEMAMRCVELDLYTVNQIRYNIGYYGYYRIGQGLVLDISLIGC